MMDRRMFLGTLVGGPIAAPLAAGAQQAAHMPRIGFLGANSASSWASRVQAFRTSLRDLGYEEGKNIVIEFRWAEAKYSRLPELAAALVHLKIDVLVTYGTPGTLSAKRATTTIPIVMVHSGDAVAAGIVTDLARPGGNVTGSTFFLPQLMAKRLELLKTALPHITRAGVLVKPDNPFSEPALRALETAANSLQVKLLPFEARGSSEFEIVFSEMATRRVQAVVILEDAVFVSSAKGIADLASRYRLPSAGFNEFAAAGGLIGYGVDFLAMYRRAAVFVDKILKGAKPADIPVEQATRFEFGINLKNAKALGLTIPSSLLQRADQVID
jgi:putative ABC transport system substrate-binding protein